MNYLFLVLFFHCYGTFHFPSSNTETEGTKQDIVTIHLTIFYPAFY